MSAAKSKRTGMIISHLPRGWVILGLAALTWLATAFLIVAVGSTWTSILRMVSGH